MNNFSLIFPRFLLVQLEVVSPVLSLITWENPKPHLAKTSLFYYKLCPLLEAKNI